MESVTDCQSSGGLLKKSMGEIISSRCPILNSMWKILAALKVICPVSWNFFCILVLYNCKICLKRRVQYGKSCQKALKRTLKEGRGVYIVDRLL